MHGDHERAIESSRAGLELARSSSAAMEAEPEILASLADCELRRGALANAEETARLAMALARRRSARLAECRATIICGAALRARGASAAEVDAQSAGRASSLGRAAQRGPAREGARAGPANRPGRLTSGQAEGSVRTSASSATRSR